MIALPFARVVAVVVAVAGVSVVAAAGVAAVAGVAAAVAIVQCRRWQRDKATRLIGCG